MQIFEAAPPDGGPSLALHGGAGGRVEELALEGPAPHADGLLAAYRAGWEVLAAGGSALDAVCASVEVLENDPLFNAGRGAALTATGQAELDASVMTGTGLAGAVAASKYARNPVRLARTVMERTNHVMLAGEGAHRFAVDEGFEDMNLLTERSRIAWLAWKAKTNKNWRPGLDSPDWKQDLAALLDTPEKRAWASHIEDVVLHPPTGTINCLAVDAQGAISGTTSTSGLSWKIAGRVGDSPVIGAGLYVDNDVGAAGSTGKGEENIKIAGGHTVVEAMRRGATPADACLEALKRVAHNYNDSIDKLRQFHLKFYAINKSGDYGGVALWQKDYNGKDNATFAVDDGNGPRLVDCAFLFGGAGVIE